MLVASYKIFVCIIDLRGSDRLGNLRGKKKKKEKKKKKRKLWLCIVVPVNQVFPDLFLLHIVKASNTSITKFL